MGYAIAGLDPAPFQPLFALSDNELAVQGARRVSADADRGFPCRISLRDAAQGETLILLPHVSHDVPTAYRSGYAIYVREQAIEAARFIDRLPPVFAGRTLSLRALGADGWVREARLVAPDAVEPSIAELFLDEEIAYLLAFNAAYGCFAARIDRHDGAVS